MIAEWDWEEKYRPRTVQECVLPAELKETFQQLVDRGSVQNMILAGGPGMGKTSVARAMLEELGCDYVLINGSMKGNIDTLRYDIQNFASSMSLSGGRKYVVLDEADYLNPNSTQPALRGFIDEFSRNCGFIMTCNYVERIIEALQSRCTVVEFKIQKKEGAALAGQFFKRACSILTDEGVEYQKNDVAEIINRFYPDWRRSLNRLQASSTSGTLRPIKSVSDQSVDELAKMIVSKNFTEARKWVAENLDEHPAGIFRKLFDTSSQYIAPNLVPALVILIGKYQHQACSAVDQEINLMALIAELMIEGIYEER